MSYRCSECYVRCPACTTSTTTSTNSSESSTTTTSWTPTPTSCDYGTAFGYQDQSHSYTLDSQCLLPQGCNRWGWYETPTAAELQAGISGMLYIGAGRNDLSKAVSVGSWSTIKVGRLVSVTYTVAPPYSLSEVHVDLDYLPMDKCAPGSYTFSRAFSSPGVAAYTTTPGIPFSCVPGRPQTVPYQ